MPDGQGRARFVSLQQFEQRTGKRHPDLEIPEPHAAMAYLLGWWREISRRRQSGPNGAEPISHHEIAAWAHLTGRALTLEEFDALRRMDDACMAVYAEAAEKRAAENRKATK